MCRMHQDGIRAYWKSWVEKDKYECSSLMSSLIFRMRKHTWHWELKYSLRLKSGMHEENEDNTWKEQMEGAWEAMSWIIIQQEGVRQLDTIRARVIEQSNWRQDWRKVHGTWTKGSGECRNRWKCTETCEDVWRSRNWVAEVGFKYFCLDYVIKNGVSVTERNSQPH